jgi:hypothetical protein
MAKVTASKSLAMNAGVPKNILYRVKLRCRSESSFAMIGADAL